MSLSALINIIHSSSITSDKIWLSIDALPFLLQNNYRRPSEIAAFFEELTSFLASQTKYKLIIFPSFTFDFGDSHYFNPLTSIPSVNAYSRYLFKIKYPFRSHHPFYSFYCFGPLAQQFCENTLYDSVGNNSIFSFLNSSNFTLLCIGHHYAKALSNVHQIEFDLKCSYRELCHIPGSIISQSVCVKDSSFNFYGRISDLCEFSGLTELGVLKLHLSGLSKSHRYIYDNFKYGYYHIDLNSFTSFIYDNHTHSSPLVSSYHHMLSPPVSMPFMPQTSNKAYSDFLLAQI